MATINGSTANKYIDAKIEWSVTQNTTENYSNVTATLYYKRNNSGHTTSGKWSGSITINDVKTTGSKSLSITNSDWVAAMSVTTRINHDDDGSKSISISASGSISGSTLSSTTCGQTNIVLTQIPRASTISSASDITLGNACNIKWTPASSSFKYKIKFELGSWNYTTGYITPNKTSEYTYNSYTISGTTTANSTTIYAQLPNSTSGTMTATLTTYNSSNTQIGSAATKTFTVTIPDSVKPTMGTIGLSPATVNSHTILLQNKNKITFSVSGCAAGTGSSMKNYKFDVLSGSTVIATQTTTNTSVDFGPFSQTGTLKFRLTVTDNRGRSVSNSGSERTYMCYEYATPSFSSFTANRCNNNEQYDVNGEKIKYSLTITRSDVGGNNTCSVHLYYKTSTGAIVNCANPLNSSRDLTVSATMKATGTGSVITFDKNQTYMVYANVVDKYGGTSTSSTITIFGSSRIFNIRPNGSGIAFGKMSENDNKFEVSWGAKFHKEIECGDVSCSNLKINNKTILDLIYPVGSIYMSVNSTDPKTIFGGTWERLKDRFLLGAGDTYTAGVTAGSSTVTLTDQQVPLKSHNHTATSTYSGADFYIRHGESEGTDTVSAGSNVTITEKDSGAPEWSNGFSTKSYTHKLDKVKIGGTVTTKVNNTSNATATAHDNMPPYLAVYMWKRTA